MALLEADLVPNASMAAPRLANRSFPFRPARSGGCAAVPAGAGRGAGWSPRAPSQIWSVPPAAAVSSTPAGAGRTDGGPTMTPNPDTQTHEVTSGWARQRADQARAARSEASSADGASTMAGPYQVRNRPLTSAQEVPANASGPSAALNW
jgi:hypothetical protein